SLAFGTKDGKQMPVRISKVRDPVRGRGLPWFTQERNTSMRQGAACGSHAANPESYFGGACNLRGQPNVARTQAQRDCAGIEKGELCLLHLYLQTQGIAIELQGRR